MEPLNKQIILDFLDEKCRDNIELELHQQLESTNSYLLEKPSSEKVRVCLAENQTHGRGRYGKTWISEEGSSIYMSLSHRISRDISKLSGLSLVIGIALAETLQTCCRESIGLKWPNDLLVNNKKLSGILIEIKDEADGGSKVVTGIGINVAMSDSLLDSIPQPATSLQQCNVVRKLSRNAIVADLLENLLNSIEKFQASGFKLFHKRWNELDIWLNQEVEIKIGTKKTPGIHRGVDLTGSLLLEQQGKLNSWNSGEVSLRRLADEVID